MTGGEEALTEASNQPGIPPFRFYICYCWSGEWIYYLCQQTNTKNKKRLGVHATNQLLKEKQELPRQTTRTIESSNDPIGEASCSLSPHFPWDQEKAPKKKKDWSQSQVQWLVGKPFQANLLIHIHVKPLQPILHTNHPPLTVMALSQGFYGFSPVEKDIS